jgi:isopentenyl-diphosphate delta-isomerase
MSDDNILIFEQRKRDHIEQALNPDNQSASYNYFDKINLLHEAIPSINFSDIDLKTKIIGRSVATPFFISSMTAGHQEANQINFNLLQACDETGWSMAVGSQRKQLLNSNYDNEWQILRKRFTSVNIFGNLGITQLIHTKPETIKRLSESLNAAGFFIHCNPLQEAIQPEGTPNFENAWQALENLIKSIEIPIIVKETGCGFNNKTIQKLNDIGVTAIDISGMGGTHWGKIEGNRAMNASPANLAAKVFAGWGISTVSCLLESKKLKLNAEIWASGGIRHGLDAAKAIALGAKSVGFAKKMLQPALIDAEQVIKVMQQIEYECKIAMFCTNNARIKDLATTEFMVNDNVFK